MVGAPARSYADVNDFVITKFSSDQTLSRDTPHGHLDITEDITVNFTDNNHGLLRALPQTYHGHTLILQVLSVSSPSGAPANFITYGSNGNTVLKIGSASQTVTGPQEYKIHYSYDNVISNYPDHDELYWDVNGDQWQQLTQDVQVTLHTADGISTKSGPRCFVGAYGSTDTNCTVAVNPDGGLTAKSGPLSPRQTLTYVAAYAKGTFAAYTWHDTVATYAPRVIKVTLLPLLAFMLAFLLWRKKGRDAKGRGIIIPQYEPYGSLKPIEVGTIMDFSVDSRDITATIIDLAVRKYIKIIEAQHEGLLGKKSLTYSLELVNNDLSPLNAYESSLISGLFPQLVVGEVASLSSRGRSGGPLYAIAFDLRAAVSKQLTAGGYFKRNPTQSSTVLVLLMILLFLAAAYGAKPFGVYWILGGGIAIFICILFARKMPARTAHGVAALEHCLGLKLFLEVTEAERYKKLQSPNAAYTQTNEPVKTVELFEKLLPYAVALGVEKGWAEQCKDLYTQPPDWYSGNINTFSALYIANNLQSSFSSQMNATFAAPSSSNSSGFGGGGFSGGGGGGGGGGGW
ncbi:MAG: DUF2207 domain-containing protein [Patescibacteria group bacterium]|nr:DUF2207 domain-containing protein [Patescibacteria group bacterium]